MQGFCFHECVEKLLESGRTAGSKTLLKFLPIEDRRDILQCEYIFMRNFSIAKKEKKKLEQVKDFTFLVDVCGTENPPVQAHVHIQT